MRTDPSGSGRLPRSTAWWRRGATAFARFWWDFLVGDTPELTVAAAGILGAVALLVAVGSGTAAWLGLPVLVMAALAASVRRGR